MTADELAAMAATLDPTRWHVRRVFLTSGRFRGWWWVTIAPGRQRRTIRHFETQQDAIAITSTPKRRRSPDAHPAREPAPVPAELARDLDRDQGPGRLAL